jgi:hypothetical protein
MFDLRVEDDGSAEILFLQLKFENLLADAKWSSGASGAPFLSLR